MADNLEIFSTLRHHGVPFVVIGGHAVNFHGFGRATEDTDIIWLRTPETERSLMSALAELQAHYIGDEIDPETKIERIHPITPAFIKASRLMMLSTRIGFLDLFDYVPGLPDVDVAQMLADSVEVNGVRYAALSSLRQMKEASGRSKDKIDLENLPE